MKSKTLASYKAWLEQATFDEVSLVDRIYQYCEEHYEEGGDIVVECFTPGEVLDMFKSIDDVREHCLIKVEQATNARWGEDSDSELERLRRAAEWEQD